MAAAWKELQKSPAGTRHVILFSDAADSEEPGNYRSLLAEMTKEGCTVSVIGLGTPADSDAGFLKDIAKLGKGRCFFTNRPADIPRLFAQETVTIARSAFITDPVGTRATGKWSEVSAKPFSWLPQADGYNLSYARKDATTSLATTDEYLAPLVAHARRGIGRTAAVSFPLGGKYSEKVRTWPQYGDFIQTLTQWLMGDKLPPGLGLRHQLDGTQLKIDLLYDTDEWSNKFAQSSPTIKIVEGEHGGESYELQWKRISPGRFSLTRDLEEGTLIRGSVQAGKFAIPFGPIIVGSSTEWAFDKERLAELRALSSQTGGRQLTDLSKAWVRPPVLHFADLRLPLAITLLVFMLIDALLTRTGWKLPELDILNRIRKSRAESKATQEALVSATTINTTYSDALPKSPDKPEAPKVTPQVKKVAKTEVAESAEDNITQRQSRFSRAKRGKK